MVIDLTYEDSKHNAIQHVGDDLADIRDDADMRRDNEHAQHLADQADESKRDPFDFADDRPAPGFQRALDSARQSRYCQTRFHHDELSADNELSQIFGDGDAELVVDRAVVGEELGDLPARGGVEEVGGAGVGAVVAVATCSDDGPGLADRDGEAEPVALRAIVGQEFEELVAEVGVGGCCPTHEVETKCSDRRGCEA